MGGFEKEPLSFWAENANYWGWRWRGGCWKHPEGISLQVPGDPGHRDCGKDGKRASTPAGAPARTAAETRQLLGCGRWARTRGAPRPDDGDFPCQRASPWVLLFLGPKGRAAGLRGTPTCIYLQGGDNKRPCRPGGQGPRSPSGRGA